MRINKKTEQTHSEASARYFCVYEVVSLTVRGGMKRATQIETRKGKKGRDNKASIVSRQAFQECHSCPCLGALRAGFVQLVMEELGR